MHVSYPIAYHSLNRRTVTEIQGEVLKQGGRRRIPRFFHLRDDKDAIAAWKSDLSGLLHFFNVCPVCLCLVVAD